MINAYIVDDREVDRYTARRRLSKTGRFNALYEADSGPVFLSQLYKGSDTPDISKPGPLVLMDISMPIMDGFETVEALKAKMVEEGWPSTVVVVMVTSSSAPKDKARAAELGIVRGYFEKPIRVSDVEDMLRIVDMH
jgi:CheY-like chemotaxis protein